MTGKASWLLGLICLVLSLSACAVNLLSPLPNMLAGASSQAPKKSADKFASYEWTAIAPGLEWLETTLDNDEWSQLKILRVDPRLFRFRVRYSPGQPMSLAAWRVQEPDAAAIINANFFDPSYRALGLVISDGESHGSAYREGGGLFLATDERATVRASHRLSQRDLAAARQAAQGFPLLVEHGEQAYFGAASSRSRQERAPRTAIAEDTAGNILIISAPLPGPTLGDLSAFLAGSALKIESAFNLDGGASAMLAAPGINYFQPSFDAVPAILVVYEA